MRAFVLKNFGPADAFEEIDVPTPSVKAGHVLIEVRATSVNPLDIKIRSGALAGLAPLAPGILHGDVAGVIAAVGEDAGEFKPGDEVYGCIGGVAGVQGALADYALADAKLLAHKPKSLSFEEAAALPLVALTAWEALIDRVRIFPGDKVLVHGGAGGVGHIGMQLAKLQGATVYTTVSSSEKAQLARDFGADAVINYKQQTVQDYLGEHTASKGFDVVFDTIGGDNINHSIQAVSVGGHVSSILTFSSHDLGMLQQKGVSFHAVFMLLPLLHNRHRSRQGDILKRVAHLVDQKRLKPLIDPDRFTFAQVAMAHQKLENGKACGKIVLTR